MPYVSKTAAQKRARKTKAKRTKRTRRARQAVAENVWGRNALDPHSFADGGFYGTEGLYGVSGPFENPRYQGRPQVGNYGLGGGPVNAMSSAPIAAAPAAAAAVAAAPAPASQRRVRGVRTAMQRIIRELA